MITKEKFLVQINNLIIYRKAQDIRLDYLNKAFPDANSMLDESAEKLFDQYIQFLSTQVNDTCDWISYYIFDNDMGKNKNKVTIGKKEWKLTSSKVLWEVINYKEE
jgi:hypothetical protein